MSGKISPKPMASKLAAYGSVHPNLTSDLSRVSTLLPVTARMSPYLRGALEVTLDAVETLDDLLDSCGWGAVLAALIHIAKTDGFQQLVDAVQPVCDQIKDPEPTGDGE